MAQGLVRSRMAERPSGDAAGSNPAVVSPVMEPMKLTGPSLVCSGTDAPRHQFGAT
jgi:hypothetical protein